MVAPGEPVLVAIVRAPGSSGARFSHCRRRGGTSVYIRARRRSERFDHAGWPVVRAADSGSLVFILLPRGLEADCAAVVAFLASAVDRRILPVRFRARTAWASPRPSPGIIKYRSGMLGLPDRVFRSGVGGAGRQPVVSWPSASWSGTPPKPFVTSDKTLAGYRSAEVRIRSGT